MCIPCVNKNVYQQVGVYGLQQTLEPDMLLYVARILHSPSEGQEQHIQS